MAIVLKLTDALGKRAREETIAREWQSSRVHRHAVYDLEVDTSILSAEQCALSIQALVATNAHPQALISLRRHG